MFISKSTYIKSLNSLDPSEYEFFEDIDKTGEVLKGMDYQFDHDLVAKMINYADSYHKLKSTKELDSDEFRGGMYDLIKAHYKSKAKESLHIRKGHKLNLQMKELIQLTEKVEADIAYTVMLMMEHLGLFGDKINFIKVYSKVMTELLATKRFDVLEKSKPELHKKRRGFDTMQVKIWDIETMGSFKQAMELFCQIHNARRMFYRAIKRKQLLSLATHSFELGQLLEKLRELGNTFAKLRGKKVLGAAKIGGKSRKIVSDDETKIKMKTRYEELRNKEVKVENAVKIVAKEFSTADKQISPRTVRRYIKEVS